MKTNRLGIVLLMFFSTALTFGAPTQAQETVFYSGFEYDENPFVFSPGDLNGSLNQVGHWSGDDFPDGQGNILLFDGRVDTVGIVPSPLGGSLMVLDRPTGDPEWPNASENGDFTGSYFANLSKSVPLVGTEFSFRAGTRRSANTNEKDYDIIGLGSDGSESFHIRIGTENTERGRVGYLSNESETLVFDLPTVVGSDKQGDMPNIFGFNAIDGPGLSAAGSDIVLRLREDGFVVDFSHPPESTSSWANAYVTELLSYNGDANDLAVIEFTYEASTANPRTSGYTLDEVLVTTNAVALVGDCVSDGVLDASDLSCVATIEERDAVVTALGTVLGDLDGNGTVLFPDFLKLSDNYGQVAAGYVEGNIDLVDGVAFPDFLLLSDNFGTTTETTTAVPEPNQLGFLWLVFGLCVRLKRIGFNNWIR